MRTYNAGVPADRRVKFVGFDIQFNNTGKTRLLDYLKRVAPERVSETEEFFKVNLDDLNSVASTPDKQKDEKTTLKEQQIKYGDLFVFLELSGASLTAKSSPAEYAQMREFARVCLQYIDSYSRPGFTGAPVRDLYMADNFRRAVEREPAGTRFVLWAHNGHISTGDSSGAFQTLGYHLRRFYGKDYYAVGFSFDQGSFQSRELQPKDPAKRMLMAFTASPAPAESIDWYLSQSGVKAFVVDFRAPRKNPELEKWLAEPHPMRIIGSIYAPSMERASFVPTTVGSQYDGLFFVSTTTRARPNATVKNVAPAQ